MNILGLYVANKGFEPLYHLKYSSKCPYALINTHLKPWNLSATYFPNHTGYFDEEKDIIFGKMYLLDIKNSTPWYRNTP